MIPEVKAWIVKCPTLGTRYEIDTINKRFAKSFIREDHPETMGHKLTVSLDPRSPAQKRLEQLERYKVIQALPKEIIV